MNCLAEYPPQARLKVLGVFGFGFTPKRYRSSGFTMAAYSPALVFERNWGPMSFKLLMLTGIGFVKGRLETTLGRLWSCLVGYFQMVVRLWWIQWIFNFYFTSCFTYDNRLWHV